MWSLILPIGVGVKRLKTLSTKSLNYSAQWRVDWDSQDKRVQKPKTPRFADHNDRMLVVDKSIKRPTQIQGTAGAAVFSLFHEE